MIFTKEQSFLQNTKIGGTNPFFLIAGPCMLESLEMGLQVAEKLKAISKELGLTYIFKASFDKANRTSIHSYRGPGIKQGLEWLAIIKKEMQVPILTDIHLPQEAETVAEVADILQIPAFLCRQTDIIVAAAKTGKWVNIKKGQFMAPHDAVHIVNKVIECESEKYMLTERGSSLGYNQLVTDFKSFEIIRKKNIPFIFDATHSVQVMGGGETSGGNREFIPVLCRSAVAAGIEGLFLEVHPDPPNAKSDSSTQLYLDDAGDLLKGLVEIDKLVKGR